MRQKIFFTLVLSILIVSFAHSCNGDNLPVGAKVVLSIEDEFIANQNTESIDVKGYPIRVVIQTNSNDPALGYYVHIFQKESGAGQKYYYQGSAGFFQEYQSVVPIWLGRGGSIDLGKNFDIYAVVNKEEHYEKDSDGVAEFRSLPNPPITAINVRRVE